jgi:MHS family proline/betaine transporter-like MFS transporter
MRQVPHVTITDLAYSCKSFATPKLSLKPLLAAAIGNAYELYDYVLYAILLSVMSPLFFPSSDPKLSYLMGSASFAVAFLFTPLGSVLFGWVGDLYGRKKMLNYSLMLMGLPSLIIALLPDYQQIGMMAPIMLIFCRIIQSLSASGEVSGSKIFAMEHQESGSYGISAGILSAFAAMGVLLAMMMGALATMEMMPDWFWRVPFLFGSMITWFGCGMRRRLIETPEFQEIKTYSPFNFRKYKYQMVMVITLSGFMGMISYLMHGFMSSYLKFYVDVPLALAMKLNLCALLSTIVFSIIGGWCIDRIGTRRVIFCSCIIVMLLSLPVFYGLLSQNIILLVVGEVVLGGLLGVVAVANSVSMMECFPVAIRCRATGLCYTIGMSIFGGTTPFLFTYLIEQTEVLLVPAFVLMIFAAIVFVITLKYEKSQ